MNKFSVFIFLLVAGCKSAGNAPACIDPSKIKPDAVCYELYKPVCGCDGKTYSNDCVAQKSGLTAWTAGACEEK